MGNLRGDGATSRKSHHPLGGVRAQEYRNLGAQCDAALIGGRENQRGKRGYNSEV